MTNYKCSKCSSIYKLEDNLKSHYKKCIYYRYSCLEIENLDNYMIDNIMLISNLLLLDPKKYVISKNNILLNLEIRRKLDKKNKEIIDELYNLVRRLTIEIIYYNDIVDTIAKLINIPIRSIIALNHLFYNVIDL